MGYAVRVDPDALAAGARALSVAAGALDDLSRSLLGLTDAASAAAGAPELSAAVVATGRETARAVADSAAAVAGLEARTASAAASYRLLEDALSGRAVVGLGPGRSDEHHRAQLRS